ARLIQEGTRDQIEPLNSLDQAIRSVCNEAEAHNGRGITLEEIARKTGYNKHYFCRAFKARVGTTLHAFIDECRIRKVATWLGERRSHKEIGALLGFSGAASFSRWHRKHRLFIDAALKTTSNAKQVGKRGEAKP
ncbi:MAG: helix-turn-helix domain-containing protein, partial [Planctomycetota bacterium]